MMTTLRELTQFVERLVPQVEAMFEADGRHAPIAFVMTPTGVGVGVVRAATVAARRVCFEAACRDGATALAFIAEGWAAAAQDAIDFEVIGLWKAERGSLETLPGREEVLSLWAVCPDGGVTRTWRIERPSDGRPRLVRRDGGESNIVGGILFNLPWASTAKSRLDPREEERHE